MGLALGVGPALAEGDPRPSPPSSGGSVPAPKATKEKKKKTKKQKKADARFYERYAIGFNLIQAGMYAEAISAFRAIGHDDHPDVANYIGFASRKLGNYAEAEAWYQRALAADPKHVRTWQYYGMWHVEQGNMLKAQDHLEVIAKLCGQNCKEFADLKGAMEGTVVY
jgi:tetratricopeptide (TPR) repeat protein